MADSLSPVERSEQMRRVRCKDTKPELIVRRLVHSNGFRYRLHQKRLPGCPDLVFAKLQKVVFIHGCFWHRHASAKCLLARLPKSRLDFWLPKLEANRLRDHRDRKLLRQLGWKVLVVWECELRHIEQLENKLVQFLEQRDAGYRTVRRRGRAGPRG